MRTEDSAQVHQTLFLLLGVGSGDETTDKMAHYEERICHEEFSLGL